MTDTPAEKQIVHRGRIVRAEIRTTAAPEKAYEAWADPEKIAHWFPDKAEGRMEPGATITWIFDKFNYRIPYDVLVAQPAKKLVIRWNAPVAGMSPGILEVTIAREGGETVVRLVNSGFGEGAEWDEQFEGVDSGWQMALSVLKHYLENYFGMPRSSFLAMRPANFTYAQLLPHHRTAAGLAKWLTTEGGFGAVGETFLLKLRSGGTVTGKVLALTKMETQLSWPEIHGVLGLKAFNMGPQKMVGVHGCGWGLTAERAKEIESQMDRALETLAQALSTVP